MSRGIESGAIQQRRLLVQLYRFSRFCDVHLPQEIYDGNDDNSNGVASGLEVRIVSTLGSAIYEVWLFSLDFPDYAIHDDMWDKCDPQ